MRRGALDRLRGVNRRRAIEEEEARLEAILKRIEERRQRMEDMMEDLEHIELQNLNVFNVSKYYINYDREYETKRMSSMLFSELAEESGYLSGEQRRQLFGPEGFVNTGFPVEGPLPVYGSWPTARPLSATEKTRLHTATVYLQQRLYEVNAAGKFHDKPYAFETEQTLARCYAHVRTLMDGPLATELAQKDVPQGTWIFPYFGLGQKWDESSAAWRKVRPIANEKKRNNLCSPLAEHLVLPGTDTLVDMSFYCLNPTYLDSVNETRADVIASLEKGRKKAQLAKGAALQWMNLESMPKPAAKFEGHAFTPTHGKLDMKLDYYEQLDEAGKNQKRPRAPNIVPKFYSAQWPMSDRRTLFLFPEEGPTLMAEGGLGTRNSRWRAGQLQTLTYDNLNRYSQLFEPVRAMPPDLNLLPNLTPDERSIFKVWSCTGLRKISFASIRRDCVQISDDKRFIKAMIPCIKSLPVPGEHFFVYIPRSIYAPHVFPVGPLILDTIAHKLRTTSHGVRRALALYLRRRCAEVGIFPDEYGLHSKECLTFRQKVNHLFGWTIHSTMWEDVYSKDIALHRNAKFAIHEDIDHYFTGEHLRMVLRPIQRLRIP
eukprot:g3770.t1